MKFNSRNPRTTARIAACTLAFCTAPFAANAQQAAEPAATPAELPPLEVTAKAAQKKAPAKKAQAKAAPKAASQAQPAEIAAPPGGRPSGVTNGASPVKDYVATSSTAGTKTDTPLKETPQSITVVGKEQMRDQGVQSIQEAFRYVPGVFADPYGPDSRGDSAIIRGIAGSYFIDGLRTTYGYSQTTAPIEPYALERAEVLRGPASMLYGQAPTGGIINGASKLPSEIPYREIGVEYGSFDFKQVKFDATGKLTEDGKWLYRIVGLGREADTQVDYVDNDRLMLAPSLTYRPTNDTSITVLGNFRKDQSGSTQQFLPALGTLTPNDFGNRVKHSTFAGEPTDHYDTDAQSVSVFVDHKFGEYLKLHHASRYAHTENDYDSTYAAILTPSRFSFINGLLGSISLPPLDTSHAPFLNQGQSEIARARTITYQETDVFNSDTNLTGKFRTGWIDHKVTGGFDYMNYSTDQMNAGTLIDNLLTETNYGPFAAQPIFDIYNPIYGRSTSLLSFSGGLIPANAIPLYARPHEEQTQTGLYIQDQLKMGPWSAVLGLRQDWLKVEQEGQPDEDDTATTGRAALMYNFDFGLTPYVSYSTSFTPQPGNPVGDNIFVPFTQTRAAKAVEGEQVEIGFKYQPNGAPFVINAAAYELTDKNQIVQPDILFQAVQGADVKVRGFEIEAIGRVTPELKVIGSYSFTDATYEKYPELYPVASGIPEFMEGKRVDGIPQHLASLWAIYSVQDGLFKGLSFGGGVRYVGEAESWGRDIATQQELHIKTPSYTLFDAMIAYETEDWRWQLTAQNLEDKFFVTSCAAYRGDCFIGQARTIITGFTYKF
ncbi:TonB-dependent siderophore receptor [Hyphomicrobium sp. LHD-15]|uniref:TonB-dependent siderophore receptor n=1 Tax=Hyphomicrobium sp. LHD-15 TaxID=3072142 RepID=UPI00280D45DB|nr:TonB-dependent siderophore receptor [Hyphomicrobium sp. LHD-15]MDQ8698906.1 TonB-dependent siderophore receptor [Hyphomicrobium sp. LHD-15]